MCYELEGFGMIVVTSLLQLQNLLTLNEAKWLFIKNGKGLGFLRFNDADSTADVKYTE
jgi:hypothetical protein